MFSNSKDDFWSETDESDFTYDFFTMDSLIDFYDSIREEIQTHIDFVEDITGLTNLTTENLEKVISLEKGIQEASAKASTSPLPEWQNRPMTPVMSSFIKSAGAYKGQLLLEFHHDPGNIWGFPVEGQGGAFFQSLLNSGSKGGWVWDKILGRPSKFGMAKGSFHAYQNNGKWNYFTSKGAQFVHQFERPAKFTYNPVGYSSGSEQINTNISENLKEIKERLVEPPESREPIEAGKLLAEQRKRTQAIRELGIEFRRLGRVPFPEIRGRERTGLNPKGAGRKKRRGRLTEAQREQQLEERAGAGRFLPQEAKQFGKDLLTQDYPVEGYTTKAGIKKKAHTRGEGKSVVDKAWDKANKKYPDKDIHVTKSGRIYIKVVQGKGSDPIQRGTAKAIKVSGSGWIPRSQSFSKGNDPRYAGIFVSEWFYDKNLAGEKKGQKLSNERIFRWEREVKELESSIEELEKLKSDREKGQGDPEYSHLKTEDIPKPIKQFKGEIKSLKERIAEEIEFLKEGDFWSETDESDFDEYKTINFQDIEGFERFTKEKVIQTLLDKDSRNHERFLSLYRAFKEGAVIGKDIPPIIMQGNHLWDGNHRIAIAHFLFGINEFAFAPKSQESEVHKEFGLEFVGTREGQKTSLIGKEIPELTKKEIQEIQGSGKGRGWHGEPERHSQAAKKGKQGDFDESKGRWVTISGRKIFIKKGDKVQFHSGGRFKVVSKKKFKEKKKKRVEKKIEETGFEKERAEKSVKAKRERRKEKLGYKKEKSVEELKEKKAKVQKKLKNAKDGRERTFLQKLLTQLSNRIAARIGQSKKDDLTEDSFDDLISWVQANIASNYEAAKEIAFKILQKQRSEGKEKGDKTQWEKNWGWLRKEFEILGLKKENITKEKVKLAFFRTAKKTHPDRKGGSAKKFMEAHKAKEKLMKEVIPDFIPILKAIRIGSIRQIIHNRGDTIPLSSFTQLTEDLGENSNFVMFHGVIARDGPYKYKKNGVWVTLHKDFDNLKDIYAQYDYLPLKVSEKKGAHYAEEFGFGFNFKPNEATHEIEADLVIVDPSQFNEIKNKDYHVSPGYNDIVEGNLQILLDLDHIALALGPELSRGCTGTNEFGKSCTKVKRTHDQNLNEVILN